MMHLMTVKSSAVPTKLCRVERTFTFWNGFLAHNINENLNCNKYKLGERIVRGKLYPLTIVYVRFIFFPKSLVN